MKIDETSIAIIKHLRDGRKSYKRIAEKLGLTENTVRARVKKLMDSGVLDICGQMDPASIPGHHAVYIGVKLGTANMFEKAESFSKLRGVVSVAVVTGRYDLMVVVLFNSEYGLEEFYMEEIPKVSGIQAMETFVIYKNLNLKVPYLL